MASPYQEIVSHGNEHYEANQVHDPRGFGVNQVYDSDHSSVIAPKLKAFAGKVEILASTGNNDRKKFLPFNTDPIAFVKSK